MSLDPDFQDRMQLKFLNYDAKERGMLLFSECRLLYWDVPWNILLSGKCEPQLVWASLNSLLKNLLLATCSAAHKRGFPWEGSFIRSCWGAGGSQKVFYKISDTRYQYLQYFMYTHRQLGALFHLDLIIQSMETESSRETKCTKNQNPVSSIFVESQIFLWHFNVLTYMLNRAAFTPPPSPQFWDRGDQIHLPYSYCFCT